MFWRQTVSSLVIWACPLHSPGHLREPPPTQGYPIHACREFMDLSGSGVWLPLFQAPSQAMKQQGLAYKEVLYLLTGFSHPLSWWKVNSSLRPLVDALLKQQCASLVAVVFCTCVSSSTLRWLESVVCWMRVAWEQEQVSPRPSCPAWEQRIFLVSSLIFAVCTRNHLCILLWHVCISAISALFFLFSPSCKLLDYKLLEGCSWFWFIFLTEPWSMEAWDTLWVSPHLVWELVSLWRRFLALVWVSPNDVWTRKEGGLSTDVLTTRNPFYMDLYYY